MSGVEKEIDDLVNELVKKKLRAMLGEDEPKEKRQRKAETKPRRPELSHEALLAAVGSFGRPVTVREVGKKIDYDSGTLNRHFAKALELRSLTKLGTARPFTYMLTSDPKLTGTPAVTKKGVRGGGAYTRQEIVGAVRDFGKAVDVRGLLAKLPGTTANAVAQHLRIAVIQKELVRVATGVYDVPERAKKGKHKAPSKSAPKAKKEPQEVSEQAKLALVS